MKNGIIFVIGLFFVSLTVTVVRAENYIDDYGYYDNVNEVSAKDRLIGSVDNIFDFNPRPNPGGERIENGRYYVPIRYSGGNNGIDEDYIYADELIYNDNELKEKTHKNSKKIKKNRKQIKRNRNLINSLATQQTIGIQSQASAIKQNSQRIDSLENRIGKLEETQYIIGGGIRLYDGRKWEVNAFLDYSTNTNKVDRTGVRFTYKFGESYEERRITELERRLRQLEAK